MHFTKYLKTAFLGHWNLLVFLSGSAFALLSGKADVLLPLVLAGEAAYVGLLGSHPKFQQYVDVQEAKAGREKTTQASQQSFEYMLRTLPRDLLTRFQTLRAQCVELRRITADLGRPGMSSHDLPLEQLQLAKLDRLLWIHLRMLYTKFALTQFLEKTKDDEIQMDITRLEGQLKQLPADETDPYRQRMRAAVNDNLETCRNRLANLGKARANLQMIDAELDRLENKIRALSEMAVNRQEPDFITSEVDHVAASMLDTERTMNDLQFATGMSTLESEPPEMLRRVASTQ